MDFERFEQELRSLFDEFPDSEHPRGRRFAHVLEQVPGLARENNLALLNLAASFVEPGESYVEIGTHHGTSLIAAMLGNDGRDFVAVDNFSFSEGSRVRLEANLARFTLERPTVVEGDAFELIPGGALGERRVSVYYYDNGHEYQQQLDGLRMIEPWLAERALLIVDDTDWERVARATRAYLDEQPRARLLVWIPGKDNGYPAWWEGVQVLSWDADVAPVADGSEAAAALEVPV